MSSTDDRGTEGTARAGDVDARVVITPRVREEGRQVREGARALVFKPSRLTIAVALVAVVGALPLLLSVPFFWLSLLIPAGIVVWVLRTRTTVDPDELTVRTVTSSRTVRWDDVRGLRLGKGSSVNAVRTNDTELTLAAVKVRDLPALSLASGGRVADPAGD